MKINSEDFLAFILLNLRHHLKKETNGTIISQFHRELCSHVEGEKVAIAAPRGYAKSSYISFFYPLYLLLTYPGIKICIASATYFLAEYWAEQIRKELTNNDKLIQRYGEMANAKGCKWTNELFDLPNGSSMMSRGYGQAVRGFRPGIIILDDLETDEIVANKELRDKFDKWFNETLMGTLLPDGRVVYIGTILDTDSFLANLFTRKREGWQTYFYAAIMNGHSIWPEMWSDEALEKKRSDVGEYAFQQEYMNNPIPAEFRKFQRKWFKYYERLPRNVNYFMAVDLAIKTGDKNDFTAIIVVAMDDLDNMYVVAYKRARMLPKETVDFIFEYYERYNVSKIGIEEVGFQDMLIHEVKDQRVERSVYPVIVPLKSGGKRKGLRIESLQPRFECGKIFFKEGMDELETELLRYPSRCHDDLIDAMAYLLQIIQKASTPKTRQNPNAFSAILERRRTRQDDEDYWGY